MHKEKHSKHAPSELRLLYERLCQSNVRCILMGQHFIRSWQHILEFSAESNCENDLHFHITFFSICNIMMHEYCVHKGCIYMRWFANVRHAHWNSFKIYKVLCYLHLFGFLCFSLCLLVSSFLQLLHRVYFCISLYCAESACFKINRQNRYRFTLK